MIIAASRLIPPAPATHAATPSAGSAALRALLAPGGANPSGAITGNDEFIATWSPSTGDSKRVDPPAREPRAAPSLVSGLAQLLKDIALVTRASAAAGERAANESLQAAHTAHSDATGPDMTPPGAAMLSHTTDTAASTMSTTTQHAVWVTQAWPGQRAEFQITRWPREHHGAAANADEADEWRTRVRVDLPRLGKLEAAVGLSSSGLRITLRAADTITLSLLESGRDEFQGALAHVGLHAKGFHISRLMPE